MTTLAEALPSFPWDRLAPYKDQAATYSDGLVDLSVGTPVDPTPPLAREALSSASDAPGYPQTHGTPELRQAIRDYLVRRWSVHLPDDDTAVLPIIGAKEFIAWLPTLLGLGAGDTVVIPETAYPTYEVGARIAGADAVQTDDPFEVENPALIWLNSPANPTGRITPRGTLAKIVSRAREIGALVASDECYLEYAWEGEAASILQPDVCGGTTDSVISVHSLSKRSNLAGYRAGFVAGDPVHAGKLLAVRRHAGMIVPRPVQETMTAVLGDDTHVDEQRARYAARRARLKAGFERAGFSIDHSEGSLYLWATRGEDCWETVRWCARRGILVTPGDFYGAAGARHVRVAFTATDERVEAAVSRLETA